MAWAVRSCHIRSQAEPDVDGWCEYSSTALAIEEIAEDIPSGEVSSWLVLSDHKSMTEGSSAASGHLEGSKSCSIPTWRAANWPLT